MPTCAGLAVVLVALAGCAPAPTVASARAGEAGLNARLFGATVDLALADGSRIEGARAVVVTTDAVRFLDAEGRPDEVRSVSLAEVVEIVEASPLRGDTGALVGAAPGVAFLGLLVLAGRGGLDGPGAFVGVGGAAVGAAIGWRRDRRRLPQPPTVLYRRPDR